MHARLFTARTLNMLAAALREVGDIEGAAALNEEAIEAGTRSGLLHPNIQGGIDLAYVNLIRSDVGAAARAWPKLWDDAHQELGNFYPWLVQLRLTQLRADIAAATADHDTAITSARDALARAERSGRKKYEVLARVTLANELSRSRAASEALDCARRAAAVAQSIAHARTLWLAQSAHARVCYAGGDDVSAETAVANARRTVHAFAEGLSDERRKVFLDSREVADIINTPTERR